MLAVIAERPGVQVWALKATSIRGTGQLMVNHFVHFFKPCVALRRFSIQQSPGQDVPTSSGESSDSSRAYLLSSLLCVTTNY